MTYTTTLTIEAGDVQIDATAEYDKDTGALVRVSINGVAMTPAEVSAALALLWSDDESGNWSRDLTAEELTELEVQSDQDAADAYGDWAMETRGNK